MNKVYKIVWHTSKRQWVVVSELAKKGKTKSSKLLAVTALASLSANALAGPCSINVQNQINVNGSNCELTDDSYTGIETKGQDNKVITVDNGGKLTFNPTNGKVTITSKNQNHALVVGTTEPYPKQDPVNNRPNLGGTVTVDGDLTINLNAQTLPPDATKKQYRPSSILLGDNSELVVNGNLNINHTDFWPDKNDQSQTEFETGAPIDVSLTKANSARITVKGETNIKSNGDGIRNGSELNDTQLGGILNFEKNVNIEANYVGLKNSAGDTTFHNDLNINMKEGKGIVQTSGSIHVKGNLGVESNKLSGASHNAIDIYGGEMNIDGITTIESYGAGNQHYASGTSLYVSGQGKASFGSELNATTNSVNSNNTDTGNGDVIKLQDLGEINLASKTSLTAKGAGNGITMGGNSKLNLNRQTTIFTEMGDGLNINGGTINSDKADQLNISSNANNGNLIKVTNGTVNLAKNTTLNAKHATHGIHVENGTVNLNQQTTINTQLGNGIHLSGGNIIAADDSQLDITTTESSAIYQTGGNLILKNTNIKSPQGYKAIILDGGSLSNLGKLTIESVTDTAAIHSTVESGKKAVFNNAGTLDTSKIDNIQSIVSHDKTGTLEINNAKTGVLNANNGNLFTNTSTGTIVVNNAGNLYGKIETGNGSINLNNSGLWEITEHSTLTNVKNAGTIHFKHPTSLNRSASEFYSIDIAGDYVGDQGTVKMHTIWNASDDPNNSSIKSDVLNISGTAKGTTTIVPLSADGTERIIDGNIKQIEKSLNSVLVVNVANSGSEVAFTGKAQTTGLTEVQLAKRTVDNRDEYYWTMKARTKSLVETNKTIYADPIAAYALMPSVNFEQGYTTLANLRERRGDIYCLNCATDDSQNTWARIFGKHQKQDGEHRLNFETNIYGFQIGHDFAITSLENNGLNLFGGYLSYNRAKTDFSDKYRTKDGILISNKKTGKGESDNFSLGITNTYYTGTGTYVDLVGQLSYLRNKYNARTGKNPSTQDGWGVALSAEAGHSIPLSGTNWSIEPQAQLTYQYLKLDSFNDHIRHVDQNNPDTLRGRVGVMFAYNATDTEDQKTSVYGIVNILHDFFSPDDVKIGHDKLSEKFNKTWGEIGLGLNIPITTQSELYGDVRYEHNFGGSKHQSFRGNIGLKINW
ncbi:autotransporter outer membrane beta-barrel domain-containing protein [Gilliamella sp. CG13]|uniref:autotransporter outer membrane beta-barrel domain-containing protein n=1 Tax=Gilliamella sp. CG13 TaxID=3351502 RepID=UPI003987D2B9